MRGDSLRDLYAKALALLGLAVLAAAGALFDYWPITNELPVLARLTTPPAAAPSIALPTEAELAAATSAPMVARHAVRAVRPMATPDVAIVAAPVEPTRPATNLHLAVAPVRLTFGQPVTLAPVVASMPEATLTAANVSTTPDAIVVEMVPIVAPARGDDDGSAVGFVTGALKKTGETIVRTGARAGGSIRDALVSFGGAFRKIL